MRKLLLAGILFCIISTCWGQDTLTVFFHPNGMKASSGYLKNGEPDGWWQSFNNQGVLISEGNRKDRLLDSLWNFYNDKGEKVLSIYYKEGKKHGERTLYSEDEFTVEQWRHDSIINAVQTYYYPDSLLKKSTPYEHGRPHGLEKEFNKSGVVTAITMFYRGAMMRREFINRTDNFGFKQGNWKFFWENGNMQMEGTYQNDKRNGFFKYYDEEGNFLRVEKYTNDQLQEDAPETKVLDKKTAYHANGKPSITTTYYKGVEEGIRREFDTAGTVIKGYVFNNGFLRYEGITDLDGKRQGIWKEYYPSGELRSQGKYVNSVMVGEWKFYFEDKRIEMVGSYTKQGKKTGEWLWYYPDGSPLSIENYNDGDLEGTYVEYDEEGNELAKGEYIVGEKDGEWVYRHGDMLEKGAYDDGRQQGTWKVWYPSGKLSSEFNYNAGIASGKFVIYWENGRTKLSGKYNAGEPEGVWQKYDEEGNLFLTTSYKDGLEYMWNSYKLK